jgi:hypothetical protein
VTDFSGFALHLPSNPTIMGVQISNLLPTLAELPRHEKLFIIQFLVSELSQQEAPQLIPNAGYPVWSPLEAHDAASVLMKLLASEKQ